jgi:hypothetical protein
VGEGWCGRKEGIVVKFYDEMSRACVCVDEQSLLISQQLFFRCSTTLKLCVFYYHAYHLNEQAVVVKSILFGFF